MIEQYLPWLLSTITIYTMWMKSGTASIKDEAIKRKSYKNYQQRAEFPEILAPTVSGAVGTVLKQPAKIKLPKAMEPLIKKATLDGLTLDGLHRRIGQVAAAR